MSSRRGAEERRTDFGYGHPVTERPPLEAAIVERVHASFARQGAMATLGAELADVAAGHVAIAVPVEPRLSQQHGFLHAGVVVAALDSACGYAALTLMPESGGADSRAQGQPAGAGDR